MLGWFCKCKMQNYIDRKNVTDNSEPLQMERDRRDRWNSERGLRRKCLYFIYCPHILL